MEQPHEVHGMLGFEIVAGAHGGVHPAELAQDVTRVRLEEMLREESGSHRAQLFRQRSREQHARRPQRFQDVWIRFQRQQQKLLQLPVDFVVRVGRGFQLLRQAVERPVQVRRRQIDPPPVVVGVFLRQAKRLGADLAAIDDVTPQIFGDFAQFGLDLLPPQHQL